MCQMGWADWCALEFGLTGVHWSQFGIKEERQMKNGRPSQELHGGGDCFNLIFLIWFCYIRRFYGCVLAFSSPIRTRLCF